MENKISVVILTYHQHEALELCLRSAIEGQQNKNQIIVVENGYWEPNEEIFKKYANNIDIMRLEENVGMMRAMNLGTYNAENELILHVHDDNVFPLRWDENIIINYLPGTVLTPNQIEPRPSMFRQFHILDLGTKPSEFDLKQFCEYETFLSKYIEYDYNGSTFPFMMNKIDYLKIGGMDESYPGPWVVDWEFFMKCKMAGMDMIRTYNCHFYHFGSLATSSPEKQQLEQQCHDFALYKWKTNIKHNPENNNKFL